jgi:hypothetical protein
MQLPTQFFQLCGIGADLFALSAKLLVDSGYHGAWPWAVESFRRRSV